MRRTSLDLQTISQYIHIKVGLILDDDNPNTRFANSTKPIGLFTAGNNQYLTLKPHPYIILEFKSRDKSDNSIPFTVNLNNIGKIRLERTIDRILPQLYDDKLFFMDKDDNLRINLVKAKSITTTIALPNNSTITIKPIIFDDDIEEVGCVAIENQNGRSAIMSIDELDMICACMTTINLYTLGLQMLQISIPVFGLLKELKETQLPNKVVGFSKPQEDILYVNTTANIKPPNSIPDL